VQATIGHQHPEPLLSPVLAIGSTLHSIVLDFDQAAVAEYQRLRRGRIRVGPMDLRIAAIAIPCEATLVSPNLKDFRKVPGSTVEDWTK
jgi:predicted nucleic acid-binding protein